MYQRVIFGEIKNEKVKTLTDMNKRELLVFVSLLIFIVWIGIYPSTFLKVSEKSTQKTIERVFTPQKVSMLGH